MLVLSRKPNESIHIGDEIVAVVLEVRGNRVCLGVEAPSHVAIRRGELPPQPPRRAGAVSEPALSNS